MRRLAAVLGVLLLASWPADAQFIGPGMTPNASNATLPDARTNLLALPAVNVKDPSYGARGDVVTFTDGQITAADATFTSNATTFTSADCAPPGVGCTGTVNKEIVVSGAGAAGVPLATTIAAFTSAHVVELAVNASTTVPTSMPTRAPPAVAAGGSGYAVGDTITLTDGSVLTVLSLNTTAVKNAYVSTPAASASPPSNPVAQASTSGAGTGATFNLTWTATGQGYYGTDDAAAFAAALTAGAVGTDANYVWVPAGKYLIGTQLELPTTAPVVLMGPGNDAATLYAGAAGMTSVVHRGTTFGYGGGVRDLTVNAFKLADHAVYVQGGTRSVYRDVIALNALVSEWRCGDGTVQTYENVFTAIGGRTENAVFRPAQRSTHNFWSNASPTNGCTDSVVDGKSTFANASSNNIFDDAGGMNTYVAPHIFGYPMVSFYADYGIRCNAACNIIVPELDGAKLAAVYLAGSRAVLTGGSAQWAGDSQGAAKGALIADGVANASVIGLSALGPLGVSAANAVSQAGTADASTIVANNPGASYWTPIKAPLGTSSAVGVQIGDPTYGFYRDGSNIYTLYNGTFVRSTNSSAETMSIPFGLKNYTVATLPACAAGRKYQMAAVSDANAPTYNATIAGGGAVAVPVMCDGTTWTAR